MRAELPPICRLIGPSAAASQPLDRSLVSVNHRALADAEERFHLIVSKQSIARLAEALSDPLLKLDEVSANLDYYYFPFRSISCRTFVVVLGSLRASPLAGGAD